MKYALEISGLTKRYGSRMALRGISLAVPPGRVVGVIGPNGAGKTTTMRLLLGLIRPSGGSVMTLGRNPWPGSPDLRRHIGYLPGELKLDGRITGRDVLHHFGRLSGPVDPRFQQELIERLNLDPSRPVKTLSKGNRQKIGLVQAFMHRPDLLVLDEPTSGLDPLVQREFLVLVREARATGQAVFLSSHVISEIQQAADRVAVLGGGRLIRSARVGELRDEAPRSVRIDLLAPVTSEDCDALRRAGLEIVSVGAATGAPDVVAHATDRPGVIEGRLAGSASALIGALARLDVRDVVIEEPDLEQAVLGLYADDRNAAPTTRGAHGDR